MTFEGKPVEVPDDASDEEIAGILEELAGPAPVKSAAARDPLADTAMSEESSTEFGGALKELGSAALGAGQLAIRSNPAMQIARLLPAGRRLQGRIDAPVDRAQAALRPQGDAEERGALVGQMAEFALPEAALGTSGRIAGIRGLPRGLNFLTRQAARGGEAAAVQAAREGEVTGSAASAGAIGAGFGALGEAGGALAAAMRRSIIKNIVNVLQPRTPADRDRAIRLAERVAEERLAPMLSSHQSMRESSERALAGASADATAEAAARTASGAKVDAKPVLNRVLGEIPETLPSGAPSATAEARRQTKQGGQVLSDTVDVVSSTGRGSTRIPYADAVNERQRLDSLLAYGPSGKAPKGERFIRAAADQWRHEIGSDVQARRSDLINITRLLKDAEEAAKLPAQSAAQEAGAVGAMAAGRYSVPAMYGTRWLVQHPQWQTLSAAGKNFLSKLANTGQLQDAARLLSESAVPERSEEVK